MKAKKEKARSKSLSYFAVALLFGILTFLVGMLYLGSSNENDYFQGNHFQAISQKNKINDNLENGIDKVAITINVGDDSYSFKGGEKSTDTMVINEYDNYICVSRISGLSEFVDEIAFKYALPATEPQISLKQDGGFDVSDEKIGKELDKNELFANIDKQLSESLDVCVNAEIKDVLPKFTKQDVEQNLKLRSSFSTSYESSSSSRKNNVKLALSKFNGLVVFPGEIISFNETTGQRSEANGYKKANVILNGVYVEGVGGGVCQASTTLYGALIRSDINILEVNKHTLPASYVPLAFDAMVAENVSDLRFENNLNYPLVIKAWGDESKVYCEVYGQAFDSGVKIETRAEFVKTIPHNGDRIVKDTSFEYSDKVMYKGEYYRLKYPREGYESKAYLDYYLNGSLVESKLIRHEIYGAQDGIIIEGVEELGPGMTLPENTVKIIPPQTKLSEGKAFTQNEREKVNPSKYNP